MDEEITNNSPIDLFDNDLNDPSKVPSKKPEEPVAKPSTSSEWPSLPVTTETSLLAFSIPPGQKHQSAQERHSSGKLRKKSPEEHENDRVGKYAPYFKDNTILPIPELVAEVESKTLRTIKTIREKDVPSS